MSSKKEKRLSTSDSITNTGTHKDTDTSLTAIESDASNHHLYVTTDDKLHAFLRYMYVQQWYQLLIAGLIGANYVVAIADASYTDPSQKPATVFSVFEYFFVIMFSLELSINMRVHWFVAFWRNSWNVFDAVVVTLSILSLALSSLPGFSVFRLFRVLRIFRLMKALPKLRAIIEGILASLPDLGYSMVVLGVLMGIWAIVGVELFGQGEPALFGNFLQAMLSCFSLMLYDNIGANIRQLWVVDGYSYALIYCLSFEFLGGIILWNVVVAILLDKYLETVRKIEKAIARENAALKDARIRLRSKMQGDHNQPGAQDETNNNDQNLVPEAQTAADDDAEKDLEDALDALEALREERGESPCKDEPAADREPPTQTEVEMTKITKMVPVASMRSLAHLPGMDYAAAPNEEQQRAVGADLPRLLQYTIQKPRTKLLLDRIGKTDLGRLIQYTVFKILAGNRVGGLSDEANVDADDALLELAHTLHNLPLTGPLLQERLLQLSGAPSAVPAYALPSEPAPSVPAPPSPAPRSELLRLLYNAEDQDAEKPAAPTRQSYPVPGRRFSRKISVGGVKSNHSVGNSTPSDAGRSPYSNSPRAHSPSAPPHPTMFGGRALVRGESSGSSSLTSIVPIPPITSTQLPISRPSSARPVSSLQDSSNTSSGLSLYSAVSGVSAAPSPVAPSRPESAEPPPHSSHRLAYDDTPPKE
eukprot:gnl/Spiro4/16377_TR8794_c0_g1_i1.p1 gnl/Spiro4/16377_TR8794_c0_g1~~gnl/Spiro4/16377_TR8794_c0_g1_i1.p1  ORF type:complete len:703 (+),score=174.17 gnl/Spiro4/16377_TR8794_c0_g1_i1:116-2224(+)